MKNIHKLFFIITVLITFINSYFSNKTNNNYHHLEYKHYVSKNVYSYQRKIHIKLFERNTTQTILNMNNLLLNNDSKVLLNPNSSQTMTKLQENLQNSLNVSDTLKMNNTQDAKQNLKNHSYSLTKKINHNTTKNSLSNIKDNKTIINNDKKKNEKKKKTNSTNGFKSLSKNKNIQNLKNDTEDIFEEPYNYTNLPNITLSYSTIDIESYSKLLSNSSLYKDKLDFIKQFLNDTEQIFFDTSHNDIKMEFPHRKSVDKSQFKTKSLLVYATTVLFDSDPIRRMLQQRCLESMAYLQAHYPIKYVVFDDNPIVSNHLKQYGFDICSEYEHNTYNMPTIRGIFKYLEDHYESDFYGYINGDIFQSSYIYDALIQLKEMRENNKISKDMYIIGQRHDYLYSSFSKIEKIVKYYDVLVKYAYYDSHLHSAWGMDYFISTKGLFTHRVIDPVVVGRVFVDGYLLGYANCESNNFTSIDMTKYLRTIHLSNADKHKKRQEKKDRLYNRLFLRKLGREVIGFTHTFSANYAAEVGVNNTLYIVPNQDPEHLAQKVNLTICNVLYR